MSRYAAFALGVVLVAASDWELVAPAAPHLPPVCATTEEICEVAAKAIRDGRLGWERDYTNCRPSPYCRERRMGHEDCIVGFDCGKERP